MRAATRVGSELGRVGRGGSRFGSEFDSTCWIVKAVRPEGFGELIYVFIRPAGMCVEGWVVVGLVVGGGWGTNVLYRPRTPVHIRGLCIFGGTHSRGIHAHWCRRHGGKGGGRGEGVHPAWPRDIGMGDDGDVETSTFFCFRGGVGVFGHFAATRRRRWVPACMYDLRRFSGSWRVRPKGAGRRREGGEVDYLFRHGRL